MAASWNEEITSLSPYVYRARSRWIPLQNSGNALVTWPRAKNGNWV